MKEKDSEKKRNKNWEENQRVISSAYVDMINETGRQPTIMQVCERTGKAYNTVQAHLKSLKFEPLEHPLRVLTNDIVLSVARKALKGSFPHQKLWFELMEGWKPQSEMDNGTTGSVIAYIPNNRR